MSAQRRLTSDWKFWLILSTRGGAGHSTKWQLEEIAGVGTPNLFFREFLQLAKPSELSDARDRRPSLVSFKGDIQPAWEDRDNTGGGAYLFRVDADEIDAVWKALLFHAVGWASRPSTAPSRSTATT
jgi:hypothetical protein